MTDSILTVVCDCGKELKVRGTSAGKKVRCPDCQSVVLIPRSDPATKSGGGFPQINIAGTQSGVAKPINTTTPPATPSSLSIKPNDQSAAEAFESIDLSPQPSATTPVDQLNVPVVKQSSTPDENSAATGNPYAADGGVETRASLPPRHYPSLVTIAKVYKIVAYLFFAFNVLVSIGALVIGIASGDILSAVVAAGMTMFLAVIILISLLAVSEVIQLALDIQDNTHRAANRS